MSCREAQHERDPEHSDCRRRPPAGRAVASRSADMVLTSPPYFRLRDYHVDGQLGLEPSVDNWVDNLAAVAHQLHRVLTPTGSLWLNIADTFSTDADQGAEVCLQPQPQVAFDHLADRRWAGFG